MIRYLLGCKSITNPGCKVKHKINQRQNNMEGREKVSGERMQGKPGGKGEG